MELIAAEVSSTIRYQLHYEGVFYEGLFSEKAGLTPGGKLLYQGYFRKGLYHDEGILFADNGEVLHAGEFSHGELVVD